MVPGKRIGTPPMHIDVIFDTVCPWCFIGKRRLEAALAARPHIQPDITWHAFMLNPEMPPEGMDRHDYLKIKFGGESRWRRIQHAVGEAGRTTGISFAFNRIGRTPNTVDSHRLVRFAARRGRASAAIEALYFAYFLNGQDIGNRSVLFRIGERLGFDAGDLRDYVYSDRDVEDIAEQNARSHRLGISGVPSYVIDGDYAISGAQEPGIFLRLFDVAEERRRELLLDDAQSA